MDDDDFDDLWKILLIGDSGVGKSSILLRFADETYTDHYIATIGVDFKIRVIEFRGKNVKLQIWDTAGQERYRTITTSYYRGAKGILVVYDITNTTSFRNVEQWLQEVHKNAGPRVAVMMVGNKADAESEREVSKEQAEELSARLGVSWVETSAKEDINIMECFVKLAALIQDAAPSPEAENTEVAKKETIKLDGKAKKSDCPC